jgi:hypothetical protein
VKCAEKVLKKIHKKAQMLLTQLTVCGNAIKLKTSPGLFAEIQFFSISIN